MEKTKITVLGCGSAFSTKNGNSCFLMESGEGKLLVDAGRLLPEMLDRQNVDMKSITDVYISHAHSDHAGGLETFAFCTYDWAKKSAFASKASPTLICNDRLMKSLWENTLKGGMATLEGLDCDLSTFFNLQPIGPNKSFWWHFWDCHLVQQIHIMTGSVITDTFGLFMTDSISGISVYFVTDSQHCSPHQLEVFYRRADIIIQDTELIGVDTISKKMEFCSHVHANYGQLAGWNGSNSTVLPDDIKAKMWLTHYQDFKLAGKDYFGNPCNWEEIAKNDGFRGFLHTGQTIEI